MDNYKFASCILPALGNLSAESISSHDLNRYIDQRIGQGVKRTTVAREIRLLKAALNWAASQEPPMIVRNPIEKYRMAKGDKGNIVAPPTVTEVERILSVAEPHLTRAIMIGFRCGLRPGGEVSRLMWSDYDSERQMLRVVSSRKGLQAVRFVPVPDDLASLLCGWNLGDKSRFGRSDMPIVHFRGESVASLKRTWRRAKELAKVTRELRLYDLRHAMATAIINAGGDIVTLSQILGHSRPDTTARHYVHVGQEQHRKLIDMVPKLRCLKRVLKSDAQHQQSEY